MLQLLSLQIHESDVQGVQLLIPSCRRHVIEAGRDVRRGSTWCCNCMYTNYMYSVWYRELLYCSKSRDGGDVERSRQTFPVLARHSRGRLAGCAGWRFHLCLLHQVSHFLGLLTARSLALHETSLSIARLVTNWVTYITSRSFVINISSCATHSTRPSRQRQAAGCLLAVPTDGPLRATIYPPIPPLPTAESPFLCLSRHPHRPSTQSWRQPRTATPMVSMAMPHLHPQPSSVSQTSRAQWISLSRVETLKKQSKLISRT